MSQQTIDGLLLKEMIIAGANLLEQNREAIDALNVFPVPDGDTGTNMSLTMKSTVREIAAQDVTSASRLADLAARGALKGARGNSGVILSQILRGFARGIEGCETVDAAAFAKGLRSGADTAYKAVMKPKEGTILTVIRVISEDSARYVIKHPDNLPGLLDKVIRSGEAILAKTPDMLPALKQAGVVDSGGQGLLTVFKGWRAAFNGEKIEETAVDVGNAATFEFEDDHDSLEEIKFKYCTEFIIQEMNPGVTEDDVNRFRTRLTRIGDCVVVVGDFSLVKVHVHTNEPGKALQYACELGELVNLKIDNMAEERRERLRQAEEAQKAADLKRQQEEAEQEAAQEELKDYGMVAVSLGEGFSGIFTDLGVDHIVEGGQTMNPSIEDILEAVAGVGAKTVFVLPNNSNVILAASQAAELSDREVVVLPTKNVAMGIGAVIAFNPEASVEENREAMTAAAEQVKTGQITFAVRDTVFEDKEIKEGDIIGIHNGRIEVVGRSIHDIAIELTQHVVEDGDSLITIYYGQDTKEEDANALGEEIAALFADLDVEVQYGGQPLYYYLISAE
ncbi:MAG: DAK2 domain-containing protein [Clostridiales bacterium]|nr:DAK2 domain-containing protein [Clostridiales bacterium]MDY5350507.1 DAK2 domain-containing protein [Candidatus Ventricola sp.]